jgi:beta-phosphoglucomutase-like phosphatase (HAD superfamily)
MIKAVVFDMDGVLIDAREWHYVALNRALGLFGLEISRADHLTTFDGLPTRRKLEILSTTENLPRQLHGFINTLKQAYTMEIVSTRCKPTFIHQYALSHLKARGLKLAVGSNSIRNTVESMMQRAHLDKYLDLMLSNEDVDKPKPAPDIYLKAMAELGVAPEETLIVEDNDHGVQAVKASGAHLLTVRNPNDVTLANLDARIAQLSEVAA